MDKNKAYELGLDYGLNGANTTNCNFAIFSTTENTAEWERGKKKGERDKREKQTGVEKILDKSKQK